MADLGVGIVIMVTYINLNGGSGASGATVTYKHGGETGESIAYTHPFPDPSGTPSKTGYTFTGWSGKSASAGGSVTVGSSVTRTTTATANWKINTYKVTYSPGANGTGIQTTATKTYGSSLTLKGAIFTRTGYTQVGWATSDGGSKAYDLSGTYTSNSAVTLYPVWQVNTYKVTYKANGGSTPSRESDIINYNGTIGTFPATTRTNYSLIGWNTASDGSGATYTSSTKITKVVTLYAIWAATVQKCPVPEFTISYSVGSAAGPNDDIGITFSNIDETVAEVKITVDNQVVNIIEGKFRIPNTSVFDGREVDLLVEYINVIPGVNKEFNSSKSGKILLVSAPDIGTIVATDEGKIPYNGSDGEIVTFSAMDYRNLFYSYDGGTWTAMNDALDVSINGNQGSTHKMQIKRTVQGIDSTIKEFDYVINTPPIINDLEIDSTNPCKVRFTPNVSDANLDELEYTYKARISGSQEYTIVDNPFNAITTLTQSYSDEQIEVQYTFSVSDGYDTVNWSDTGTFIIYPIPIPTILFLNDTTENITFVDANENIVYFASPNRGYKLTIPKAIELDYKVYIRFSDIGDIGPNTNNIDASGDNIIINGFSDARDMINYNSTYTLYVDEYRQQASTYVKTTSFTFQTIPELQSFSYFSENGNKAISLTGDNIYKATELALRMNTPNSYIQGGDWSDFFIDNQSIYYSLHDTDFTYLTKNGQNVVLTPIEVSGDTNRFDFELTSNIPQSFEQLLTEKGITDSINMKQTGINFVISTYFEDFTYSFSGLQDGETIKGINDVTYDTDNTSISRKESFDSGNEYIYPFDRFCLDTILYNERALVGQLEILLGDKLCSTYPIEFEANTDNNATLGTRYLVTVSGFEFAVPENQIDDYTNQKFSVRFKRNNLPYGIHTLTSQYYYQCLKKASISTYNPEYNDGNIEIKFVFSGDNYGATINGEVSKTFNVSWSESYSGQFHTFGSMDGDNFTGQWPQGVTNDFIYIRSEYQAIPLESEKRKGDLAYPYAVIFTPQIVYRSTPNVLWGKNQIGLNKSNFDVGVPAILDIQESTDRSLVRFISTTKGIAQINLIDLSMDGITIDGGDWVEETPAYITFSIDNHAMSIKDNNKYIAYGASRRE